MRSLAACLLALALAAPAYSQESDAEAPAPSAQEQTEEILRTRKVTLNFPDTPMAEVVAFLQDITGLNFVLQRGLAEKPVSVRLQDVELGKALDLILANTGLARTFWCDVVYVHDPKQAPRPAARDRDAALAGQRLTLNFDETPFDDAVSFLRGITGRNFVVAAAARDATRDGLVSLRVRDLALDHAISLITAAAGIDWRFEDDVVTIVAASSAGDRPTGAGAVDPKGSDDEAALLARLGTQRVTLNFDDTPIGEVIGFLGDITGIGFTLTDRVDPAIGVSLRLKDISLKNAIDLIAGSGDLAWRVREGAVVFDTR